MVVPAVASALIATVLFLVAFAMTREKDPNVKSDTKDDKKP